MRVRWQSGLQIGGGTHAADVTVNRDRTPQAGEMPPLDLQENPDGPLAASAYLADMRGEGRHHHASDGHNPPAALLRAEGLERSFGALRGVDLEVEAVEPGRDLWALGARGRARQGIEVRRALRQEDSNAAGADLGIAPGID